MVDVAEHAQGGFLVEQGYFTALEKYSEKIHVCQLSTQTSVMPTLIPALTLLTHTVGCRSRFPIYSRRVVDYTDGLQRKTSSSVSRISREPEQSERVR
jgi:hypothetical protein